MINTVYRLCAPRRFEIAFSDLDVTQGVIVRPTHLSICNADQRYYQGTRDIKVLKEKLQMVCEEVLKKYGCELTFIDIIKTGRKIWSEVYFLPLGNTVDLSRLKEIHRELSERASAEFDSIFIELIPDVDEFHVLQPEEIKARRNELIRYLSNKEERQSQKSFL